MLSISRSGNEGLLPTIGVHAHAAVLPRSRLPAVIGSIRVGGCPDRDRTLEGKPALSDHGSAQITPKGLSKVSQL